MNRMRIGTREVGAGAPCLIIAEAGVNHNGDPELARRLVDVAAAAGVDAVKFQTFSADRLVTRTAPMADYQRRNVGSEESQYDLLKRVELPAAWHQELRDRCASRGILFLSTPFEETSADFLNELGVPAFKLPSGEITNTPFLTHVARMGRPLIVSTGMATLDEVAVAVNCIRAAGNEQIALLHCVSNYPAADADVNLRAMDTLREAFHVPVGYSDHSEGIAITLGAVARGAVIIEKHITLDRTLPGPDHKASLEPGELVALVTGVRRIEAALGGGLKQPAASEASTAAVARKSLVAACDLAVGAILSPAHVHIRRPGTGLPPGQLEAVMGRVVRVAIPAGTPLTEAMLE